MHEYNDTTRAIYMFYIRSRFLESYYERTSSIVSFDFGGPAVVICDPGITTCNAIAHSVNKRDGKRKETSTIQLDVR